MPEPVSSRDERHHICRLPHEGEHPTVSGISDELVYASCSVHLNVLSVGRIFKFVNNTIRTKLKSDERYKRKKPWKRPGFNIQLGVNYYLAIRDQVISASLTYSV